MVSLLEAVINATAEGIVVVGRDGAVTAYNARVAAMWGVPQELAAVRRDPFVAREGGPTDETAAEPAPPVRHILQQVEDPDAFLIGAREVQGSPERESFDTVALKDGRVFERYSAPQRLGERIVGRVWSLRDVTSRERAVRQARDALGVLAIT